MALGYNVRGPALLSLGVGAEGALLAAGYSERGIKPRIIKSYSRIFDDRSGPMVPAELQDAGEIMVITANLITIDWDVLMAAANRGDRTSRGLANTRGLLIGGSGSAFPLAITSANDAPLYCPTCIIEPECAMAFGTMAATDDITILAWPYMAPGSSSSKDTPLYSRSLSLPDD